MKKISVFCVVAIAAFMCSFVGIRSTTDNPGTISFVTDAGMTSTFTVENWSFSKCDIKADAIEKLQIEAEMDMSSIACSWKELESSVKKKKDYFYIKKFPKAILSINGATKVKDNEYTCIATLKLRDISKPITLSFTTNPVDKGLIIKGTGTVNRKDHEFTGDGPKDAVPVAFEFLTK